MIEAFHDEELLPRIGVANFSICDWTFTIVLMLRRLVLHLSFHTVCLLFQRESLGAHTAASRR
jgi:hypothetical protein